MFLTKLFKSPTVKNIAVSGVIIPALGSIVGIKTQEWYMAHKAKKQSKLEQKTEDENVMDAKYTELQN